jgi:hypothetical protein
MDENNMPVPEEGTEETTPQEGTSAPEGTDAPAA